MFGKMSDLRFSGGCNAAVVREKEEIIVQRTVEFLDEPIYY